MQYLYEKIYQRNNKEEKRTRAAILYNIVNTKYQPISNTKVMQLWNIHNRTFKQKQKSRSQA